MVTINTLDIKRSSIVIIIFIYFSVYMCFVKNLKVYCSTFLYCTRRRMGFKFLFICRQFALSHPSEVLFSKQIIKVSFFLDNK